MAEPANHSHDHAHHGGHGHDHGAHRHGEEHVHEPMHYGRSWGGRLVLFTSWGLGPGVGIKWVTLVTAFGVAGVKASMLVKYCMRLGSERRFVHYFLASSLVRMFLRYAAVAPGVVRHK